MHPLRLTALSAFIVSLVSIGLNGSPTARAATSSAIPKILIVTTAADVAPCAGGPGKPGFSLRCAMGMANQSGPGHVINFAIPASDPGCRPASVGSQTATVCKLELTRVLTLAASSTTIDGYSQPGAAPNTEANPGSGDNALIEIQLDGGQSFGGAIAVSSANDDIIRGISVTNFHTGPAFSVSNADRFTLAGSYIGVAPDGTAAGNGGGVALTSIHTAIIGGSTPADRNLIQNSAGNGISLSTYADGITIRGNTIANNVVSGIQIGGYGSAAIPAVVQQNDMFDNKKQGIDMVPLGSENCSNLLQTTVSFTPCPVIEKATAQAVSGTACDGCTVEVYIATGEPDDRGFGEGKVYLGQTVTQGGTWSLAIPSGQFNPKQQQVTATATSSGPSPATSEFALNAPSRFRIRALQTTYSTVHGRITAIRAVWHMSNQMGIAGFNVFVGKHRLSQTMIHVDPSGKYAFAAALSRRPTKKLSLVVVLESGRQIRVQLHPKG